MISSTWLLNRYWISLLDRSLHTGLEVTNMCVVWLSRVSCYLMFGVLLGLWCVVVYFAAAGYGDGGTDLRWSIRLTPHSFLFDLGLIVLMLPYVSL